MKVIEFQLDSFLSTSSDDGNDDSFRSPTEQNPISENFQNLHRKYFILFHRRLLLGCHCDDEHSKELTWKSIILTSSGTGKEDDEVCNEEFVSLEGYLKRTLFRLKSPWRMAANSSLSLRNFSSNFVGQLPYLVLKRFTFSTNFTSSSLSVNRERILSK